MKVQSAKQRELRLGPVYFVWLVLLLSAATALAEDDHWAFQPPVRPELPQVSDRDWCQNTIDRFVLARLESAGLTPSSRADRNTLLRRLYLDLIGLPPSRDDIKAFDPGSQSHVLIRATDRLLASTQFGERWAAWWLDGARYADTNGYEVDRPRSIWAWRDWVIRAINHDMPFDQFTIEQLAGDMLPDATERQIVATGFHRNSFMNEEGGHDWEQFRYESIVDRVHTTATVFMGLTLACAQCHDHKYDPFTQEEYYRFFALLNNADEPEMDLTDETILARQAEIDSQIAQFDAQRASHFPLPDDGSDDTNDAGGLDSSQQERRQQFLEQCFAEWIERESASAVR